MDLTPQERLFWNSGERVEISALLDMPLFREIREIFHLEPFGEYQLQNFAK